MFTTCVELVLGRKYEKYQIVYSILYIMTIDTFLIDPHSTQYEKCTMKPSNKFNVEIFNRFCLYLTGLCVYKVEFRVKK